MARLPDVAASSQQPVPQPTGGIAQYEPPNWRRVGYAGQVISQGGHELEQTSNILAQMNAQQDEQVARDAANKLGQARINLEFDPTNGFRSAKGSDAVGEDFTKKYGTQFDQASQQIRDSLKNDDQRRIYDQHAQVQQLQFQSSMLEHQAKETDKFNDKTDDDTVNLALRTMAQRPTDELSFQTNLAQINGTLDSMAKRKGLSAQTLAEVKGKYLDTAYSTRILSVLHGIPGAVDPNPYQAEAMFRQVQDQLGPHSQLAIGEQVMAGIKDVQMRDGARAEVFGGGSLNPKQMYPAIEGKAPLQAVVQHMESGGNPDAVSPKGAQGDMQVMPATQTDPGYGVTPVRVGDDGKPLAGELHRVGEEYLGAMSARYQNPAMTLAAYNAGPGNVDKWIAKYGDPRTGQISVDEWVKRIPFSETKNYVTEGLRLMGGKDALAPSPTANQIKAEALPGLLQRAREHAEAMYPNDPKFADGYVARTLNYANQVLDQQRATQQAASDTLTRALVGSTGDGSDAPKTIDQALAIPDVKRAFEQATPEVQKSFQDRLARGDQKLTPEGAGLYYKLLSKSTEDTEGFTKENIAGYFGQMPDHLLLQLMGLQKSINAKDATQQAKDLNWARSKSTVEDMLKPLGLGSTAKANSVNAKTTEQFYGRFNEALQQYHDQNQKWPDTQITRKLAATLLTQGKQSGGWLWDSDTRMFQSEPGKFYVPLPSKQTNEYKNLAAQYQKTFGRAPSDAELQQAYTRYKLAGGQ